MSIGIRETELVSDEQRALASRMTYVMSKFASILIGKPIGVKLSPQSHAPAWSTHNTICFAEAKLPKLNTQTGVLEARGLTLHEMAHILFTPRSGTEIIHWVRDNNLFKAFNALEDQRIETLLTAKYSAVATWLTATMLRYLLDNPTKLPKALPLLHGRKYLPADIRRIVRQSYDDKANGAELTALIDEYRGFTFPSDTERAKDVIRRYAELVRLGDDSDSDQGQEFDPNGHEPRHGDEYAPSPKHKPVSEKEQQKLSDKDSSKEDELESDEFDWADDVPEDDGGWGDEPEQDDEPSDSDTDIDGDTEGDESTDDFDGESDGGDTEGDLDDFDGDAEGTGSDADESDDDGTYSDSDAQTNGAGTSTGESKVDKDALDAIKDALDNVVESLGSSISDDLSSYQGDRVLDGLQVARPADARTNGQLMPTADSVKASVDFKLELEKLQRQADPAWEQRVDSGRLDVRRFIDGDDFEELFDRFESDKNDATDIEAIVLLDTSDSMSRQLDNAMQSVWGIKRALDLVDVPCTVLGFGSGVGIIYDDTEKATLLSKRAETTGGTQPIDALQYAQYRFANSDRKTKLLFVVTDGEWYQTERCDGIIQNLREAGVITALAYFQTGWGARTVDEVRSHNCQIVSHITKPSDILSVARSVVSVATSQALVSA